MFARRHWIPPAALIYAQLAHGLSWGIVLWSAWSGQFGNRLYGFAWIHTVALGWITMAALAVLLHALPSFTDSEWPREDSARGALLGYGCGVAWLIFGFLGHPRDLPFAGALVLAALVIYLSTAFGTIARAMKGERVQRAVARAFAMTFVFLLATALIGFGLAWMLGGRAVPAFVAALPAAHANLGILGWLTLLVFGVSMRTLRPMTGGATRMRWMHIVTGTFMVAGVPLIAAGVSSGIGALAWIGGALAVIAALGYATDVFDILLRARNPHRPPQAFVAAGVLWLLGSLAIGGGVVAGKPWQEAYVFMLLMGWVGQFVNAHLHHIGIRLLATIFRGEDDETRPQELLETRLSWLTFFAFQAATGLVVAALMDHSPGLAARGAVFGVIGWIAMLANIFAAALRARILPKTIVLR
jgi:hypothetical protein